MADENILIIGAGAAGLMAARELAKAGKRVTILEAQEHVGGRILDIPNQQGDMQPIMLGAEFIHGNAEITYALLEEAGLPYHQISGKNYQLQHGTLIDFESDKDFWPELMEVLANLKEDISLAECLQRYFSEPKYTDFRESVLRFAEGFDAADADKVSVLALKKEWEQDDEHHFRIEGGYSKLIQFLLNDILALGVQVFTQKIVNHFNWSKGYAEAICTDGSRFAGKKAVITIPVGVLNIKDGSLGSVTLSPPLPIRMNAVRNIGFGSVIKIVFHFKHAFWPDDAGFFFGKVDIPVWWTQLPKVNPVLTGWLAGPSTEKLKDKSNNELLELALISLSSLFNLDITQLKAELVEGFVMNWAKQNFARGAYSYISVKEPGAGTMLSNAVQGTLFFAGEATFTGPEVGTVEAALFSGKEAARKIVELST